MTSTWMILACWLGCAGLVAPVELDPTRYMDTDQLRPGMTGIGKTVMAGTTPEAFDVEVLSVMRNVEPARDMILIRCTDSRLQRTGVAGGMSGSPIYIRDPLDGRLKLIGALAFAWLFQRDAIAGVQPIGNMMEVLGTPSGASGGGAWPPMLEPESRFALAGLYPDLKRADSGGAPAQWLDGLAPLKAPLVAGGGSPASMAWLREKLAGTNLMAVAAAGGRPDENVGRVRLEPGGVLCIPVLQGDMSLTVVGTATEVLPTGVLGFGHALGADGEIELPLATGMIHTIVPSIARPFKLGGPVEVVGALVRDEYTGVLGVPGRSARVIPMTVEVDEDGSVHRYQYEAADHVYFTTVAVGAALTSSVTARREPPEEHTVRYRHTVRFEGLGEVTIENMTSQRQLGSMRSDLLGPVGLMMHSPFGRARVERIDSQVQIESASRLGAIEQAELVRDRLRPGKTVEVDVGWQMFRGLRFARRYTLKLPDDLAEGVYPFVVCGWQEHLKALRKEKPHLFAPRSLPELLDAIRLIGSVRADHVYLRLLTRQGGVSYDGLEMPRLPSSRVTLLGGEARSDVTPYTDAAIAVHEADFMVNGARSFKITVDKLAPL
ncbi:MAG TPA: SpoIVB peptidase S55 domain-containing protein [Phycisphaerae bacterium]|nr:SpoIVB peptidase S55 domain-containing protein [Phycisphaerae bacterium]